MHLLAGVLRLNRTHTLLFAFLFTLIQTASGAGGYKEWCGKNYELGSPAIPPLGAFVQPSARSSNLRCTATVQPYLSSDDPSRFSFILDYPDTSVKIDVVNSRTQHSLLPGGPVAPGKAPFKVQALGPPRIEPYSVECRLSGVSHSLNYHFTVSFLPPNPSLGSGSDVRKNAETGMLEVSNEHGSMSPFFPFGFYAAYDNYIALPNASVIIQDLKSRGINTMHPVPGSPYFTDRTKLQTLMTRLQKAGIWVQYDMRNSYQNLTQVATQLEITVKQPNLLAYYTADEPDASPYSEVTSKVAWYLRSRDPYRPVSLVLNCQDFFFKEFTKDADIVMTDPYPIAMKSPTISSRWGTPCNTTYGDCGCDNCEGRLTDLVDRMRRFKSYRDAMGRQRQLMIWGVPQAFNDSSYWTRFPTKQEFLTSCAIYVIEGAVGLMAWIEAPELTHEIREASAEFGRSLPTMTPYLATPQVAVQVSKDMSKDPVLVRFWLASDKKSILLMAANALDGDGDWLVLLPSSSGNFSAKSRRVLFSSAVISQPRLKSKATGQLIGRLGGLGCGAWIIMSA